MNTRNNWFGVLINSLVSNALHVQPISLGVVLPLLVVEFDESLSLLALASSIWLLVSGISAPFVGRALDRFAARSIFSIGCLVIMLGFWVLSQTSHVAIFLLAYGIMGLGTALHNPMVSVKYLSHFFPNSMGLVTGLVVCPIGIVLFPPLIKLVVEQWGWRYMYLLLVLMTVGIFMLVQLLKRPGPEPAKAADQQDSMHNDNVHSENQPSAWVIYRQLVRAPMFWVAVVSAAVIMSTGAMLMTHALVYGPQKGLSAGQSVSLISVFGAATIFGSVLMGWVADRAGPQIGFLLGGVCGALAYLCLLGSPAYWLLLTAIFVVGIFAGGGFACFSGMLRLLLGDRIFGTGIGLATLIKVPLIALVPPLAGLVYDLYGSYDPYIIGHMALLLAVSVAIGLSGRPQPMQLAGELNAYEYAQSSARG